MRAWLFAGLLLFAGASAAYAVDASTPEPPLVKAVRTKDFAAAEQLLAKHADVNRPSSDGTTALIWAVVLL